MEVEDSALLLPAQNNKPIPDGTQVRFRWHHHHKLIRGGGFIGTSIDGNSGGGWAENHHDLITTTLTPAEHAIGGHQQHGGDAALGGEQTTASTTTTMASSILALSLLYGGILLLFLLIGFCLVHCVLLQGSAGDNEVATMGKRKRRRSHRPVSRELHVILMSKQRSNSSRLAHQPSSLAMATPATAGLAMQPIGQQQQKSSQNNQNSNKQKQKQDIDGIGNIIGQWLPLPKPPFFFLQNGGVEQPVVNRNNRKALWPRRIYELQAEEGGGGYFSSCNHSNKRASSSFEID